MHRLLSSLTLLALFGLPTQAAVLQADFNALGGDRWSAEFVLVNDGVVPEITGFTVYLDEHLFSDLTLSGSPPTWDSIVVQPDLALASPGFLDAQVLDFNQPLLTGQRQGGFAVEFSFAAMDVPPMLPFEIVDADYNVLFSGVTTPVPETSTFALTALGVLPIVWIVRRRRARRASA